MEDGGCFLKKLFPIRVGDDILPCVETWLYVKNMKMDMNDLEPYWYQESHYCLTSLSLIWRSQSTGNCGLRKAIKPFPGLRFQAAFPELWSRPQRIGKKGFSELSWVALSDADPQKGCRSSCHRVSWAIVPSRTRLRALDGRWLAFGRYSERKLCVAGPDRQGKAERESG